MSENRNKTFELIKDLIRARLSDDIKARKSITFTEAEGDPWTTFVVNYKEDGTLIIKLKVED